MVLFKKKTPKEYIIYSAIIAVGIFLDQLTKWLAYEFLRPTGQPAVLIEGVLRLKYDTNIGMAFGLLPDDRWIFISISTVAIIAFIAWLYLGHADNMLYGVALSMVVSGGIGNMIDRLGFGFYVNADGVGEVIDFIDFYLIKFAIFNGADSFVCVGAGLLMLALILDLIKESKALKAQKEAEKTEEDTAGGDEEK